ncbi:MAG TPA: hypothetical protein VIG06_23800 [Kofleriaceae bacterium]|jgi:hypothetical protein
MRRAALTSLFLAIACGDAGGGDSPGPDPDAAVSDDRPDGGGGVTQCGDAVCEGLENPDICCEDCGCPADQTCSAGACTCLGRYDVSYSTDLAVELATCDGVTESFGSDCNAAIDRWCNGRGCATTGFGPVEHTDDSAGVVCDDAQVVLTSFDELDDFAAACDGDNAYSLACNLAIHRFCAAGGAGTGFGLLVHDGDDGFVACTSEAELVETTYAELATFHEGCDGTGQGMGDSCNAAISRLCDARGALTGFGPVERVGDVVTIACVPGR